jgi:hypothetical protein
LAIIEEQVEMDSPPKPVPTAKMSMEPSERKVLKQFVVRNKKTALSNISNKNKKDDALENKGIAINDRDITRETESDKKTNDIKVNDIDLDSSGNNMSSVLKTDGPLLEIEKDSNLGDTLMKPQLNDYMKNMNRRY